MKDDSMDSGLSDWMAGGLLNQVWECKGRMSLGENYSFSQSNVDFYMVEYCSKMFKRKLNTHQKIQER